mmetsp:Transcript_122204/g.390897  ORF Transcript_122204/g.390897 Transcript_122204/m.390897 type:complete len:99 (-) Transcript_122204:1846-2142(-)
MADGHVTALTNFVIALSLNLGWPPRHSLLSRSPSGPPRGTPANRNSRQGRTLCEDHGLRVTSPPRRTASVLRRAHRLHRKGCSGKRAGHQKELLSLEV